MRLIIDLDTETVTGLGSGPLMPPHFRNATTRIIDVSFARAGVIVELDDSTAGNAGVKPDGCYDGDLLLWAGTWERIGSGTSTIYRLRLICTDALTARFDASASDILGMLEIRWQGDSDGGRSTAVTVVIHNNVLKDTDDVPSFTLPPWYWGKVTSDTRPAINQAMVESGHLVATDSNGTLTAPYASTGWDYLWLAIPAASVPKRRWWATALSTSEIGGPDHPGGNLFPDGAPLLVTTETWGDVPYRVYLSNWPTAAASMEFRNA